MSTTHCPNYSNLLGDRNELLVGLALKAIQRQCNLVIDYRRNPHYSPQDRKGHDYDVTLCPDGKTVVETGLQVKSSKKAGGRFANYGRRIGRIVPHIVVRATDTVMDLASRLLSLFRQLVNHKTGATLPRDKKRTRVHRHFDPRTRRMPAPMHH